MDEPFTRRLCDGLTGAASAATLAGVSVGAWRGAILCAGVAVIAQLLRASVGS